MQFSPHEPAHTLVTEIDNLADISDLAGSPITDRQRVDIGYIVLQRCKPFKTALCKWNVRSAAQHNWNMFKTHFCDVKISLRKTGKITVDEGLNHASVVNMVLEGVQAALAEHTPPNEQANNTTETEDLCRQVHKMQQLLEHMNNAQQQRQ